MINTKVHNASAYEADACAIVKHHPYVLATNVKLSFSVIVVVIKVSKVNQD